VTPSCWHANMVPVRPKPVATSSAMSSHAVLATERSGLAQESQEVKGACLPRPEPEVQGQMPRGRFRGWRKACCSSSMVGLT